MKDPFVDLVELIEKGHSVHFEVRGKKLKDVYFTVVDESAGSVGKVIHDAVFKRKDRLALLNAIADACEKVNR